MLKARIIPCLQLLNESLVKTVKFEKYTYVGDYINTVRIFNELEVDELCFLDIRATTDSREPNYKILQEISDECFMPLSYGGGITSLEMAKKILGIGFEKVIINTQAHRHPAIVSEIANHFGVQSVVVSIDVKKNIFGNYNIYISNGKQKISINPVDYALKMQELGAGEILLTSIDREGTWNGFDLDIIKKITSAVSIPVIAHGGAGSIENIKSALNDGGASAVALGSMVVFQKKGMGVLVNFPDRNELDSIL